MQNALTDNQDAVTKITSERDELKKQSYGFQTAIHTKELDRDSIFLHILTDDFQALLEFFTVASLG